MGFSYLSAAEFIRHFRGPRKSLIFGESPPGDPKELCSNGESWSLSRPNCCGAAVFCDLSAESEGSAYFDSSKSVSEVPSDERDLQTKPHERYRATSWASRRELRGLETRLLWFAMRLLSYLSLPWYKEQNRQVGFIFMNKIIKIKQNYFLVVFKKNRACSLFNRA